MTKSYDVLKRSFDLSVGMVALVALLPVFGVVAILVRLGLGSPVLFRQTRPGLGGLPFRMLKFRTMRDAFDPTGQPLSDEQRLTPLGRILRKASLDELPALINVIRGEMSLVGPRPLLSKYLPYYTEREQRRHDVRPGITGWAQINGRNTVSWDQRLEMDAWYVENRSFRLDLYILVRTVFSTLKSDGVVVDPRSIMRDLDEERRGLSEVV